MRVLQIHKDFEPLRGGGGTARHIHGLAKMLTELQCEVRVLSPDPEPISSPYQSVPASAMDFGPHVRWADVVHVHGARSKYAVAGALRSRMAAKPFFYTPHAFYEPHNAINAAFKAVWDRTAEKFLLEQGAQTILLTDVWRRWLTQRGISTARTTIIPNCIFLRDLAVPSHSASPHLPGAPAILTVGRLDPVKRVADVIRALGQPELAAGHFHVVGRGVERERLGQLAEELGVAGRVTFHGFVNDADVAAMVGGSDVFVLASEQEGLPTALLEALIAKLPVVCTQIPGNLAITNVAEIDTTYPVGDIAALARLLAASVTTRVSEASVEALKSDFTWEHRGADILAMYRSSIADRRAA